MDFGFFGLIDVILLIGALIFIILGFKKGFMKKAISLIGILVIIGFSIVYAGQFAKFLIQNDIIYPSVFDRINGNILDKLATQDIAVDSTCADVLHKVLGVPEFIANLIGSSIKNSSNEPITAANMANSIAVYLSTLAMNVISFFILALGLFIIILILKLIASILRQSKIIRGIDGILGIVLYLTIYSCIVLFVFCLLFVFMNQEWFSSAKEWLTVDMQLDNDNFRVSKFVYEGNIFKNILTLFMGE